MAEEADKKPFHNLPEASAGDVILRAVAGAEDLRFVVVRNVETVQTIAQRHGVSGAFLKPLGQVVSATQLLATQLKGMGAVSTRFESDGLISLLCADSNPFGLVRATVSREDLAKDALNSETPFVGKGTLTVDRRLSNETQSYRGIVELISPSVAKCVAFYLDKSEQVRSCIGLSTSFDHRGVTSSGGFMIQAFADSTKENALARVEETIQELTDLDQIFRDSKTADEVLQRLGQGFELQVMSRHRVDHFCPCSRASSERALVALGAVELKGYIDRAEEMFLNCEFCREEYQFTVQDITTIRQRILSSGGS